MHHQSLRVSETNAEILVQSPNDISVASIDSNEPISDDVNSAATYTAKDLLLRIDSVATSLGNTKSST